MRLFVDLYHYSVFSDWTEGGNPAGVGFWDVFPKDAEMCQIAAELDIQKPFLPVQNKVGFASDIFRLRAKSSSVGMQH